MRKRTLVLVAGVIALIVTVSFAAFQPNASDAAAAKNEALLELTIKIPITIDIPLGDIPSTVDIPLGGIPSTRVEDIVDAIRNIGSGDPDSAGGFQVDSFFDITYEIDFSSYPLDSSRTIRTETLSMSLTGALADPDNPGAAIDAVRKAVCDAGCTGYIGHVTLIR